MNILITGANGLLGKSMVESLSDNHKVYAVVKSKDKINFELKQNIIVIEMDLSLLDLSVLPDDIEAVYYLAQSNRFREFPDGVEDMCSLNITAPLSICEWGIKNNVKKFIYASSGGVYKNPDKPVKEFFDINANDKNGFYLGSKLGAEILLKNFAHLFETFVIIRPFFMYGVGQNKTMLIPRLLDNIINKKEVVLSGAEGIKINPIYVSDASSAVMEILKLNGEYIINIAGSEIVSLKYLCDVIGKQVNEKPIFKFIDNIQPDLIANIDIMSTELIYPNIKIKEGIQKLYEECKGA